MAGIFFFKGFSHIILKRNGGFLTRWPINSPPCSRMCSIPICLRAHLGFLCTQLGSLEMNLIKLSLKYLQSRLGKKSAESMEVRCEAKNIKL